MGITLKSLLRSQTRRTIVGILVIIAALSAVAYAYWKSLPSTTGPKVTLTSSPFELSMALDKTAYSLDDNMTITFYLRNISNETVTVGKPSMEGGVEGVATAAEGVTVPEYPWLLNRLFHFGYILAEGNGTVIDRNLYGPILGPYGLVFEPNASLNQTLYVSLATYLDPYGHSLQKGAYQVSAALYASINSTNQVHGLYTWETPSIAFTIG
jgi:hypothetical protein